MSTENYSSVPSPPADINAEVGVVGCLVRNAGILDEVRGFVSPEHFTDKEAGAVFAAMCSLADAKKPVTNLTIISQLEACDALPGREVGEVLLRMGTAAPSSAHAMYFAAVVKEKSMIRSAISLCHKIETAAYQGTGNAADLLDALEQGAAKIAETGFIDAGKLVGDILPDVLKSIHGPYDEVSTAISTGFPEVDEKIGGLKPKQLITIAGAGKIGKTSAAMNIVAHVGLTLKFPVAVISHEMRADEMVESLLISVTGIPFKRLKAGGLTDDELRRYDDVQAAMRDCRIVVEDSAGNTIQETRSRLRLLKRLYKIRLAVVDYFQLMGGKDSRVPIYEQLLEVSRGLKLLANDLDLPIIVLAQLNAGGQDSTRAPRVTDIEGCKRIFKDSNVVILLDREYQRRQHDPAFMRSGAVDPKAATIEIAAIRSGETGTIPAHFHGEIHRWRTASQEADARLDGIYQQLEFDR